MSHVAAPQRDPNVLTPDEYSMLDGSEVTLEISDLFTRVVVRRKLELHGTKVILANSLIKSIAGHILVAESAKSGGAVVPATGLPPAPPSGQRT